MSAFKFSPISFKNRNLKFCFCDWKINVSQKFFIGFVNLSSKIFFLSQIQIRNFSLANRNFDIYIFGFQNPKFENFSPFGKPVFEIFSSSFTQRNSQFFFAVSESKLKNFRISFVNRKLKIFRANSMFMKIF